MPYSLYDLPPGYEKAFRADPTLGAIYFTEADPKRGYQSEGITIPPEWGGDHVGQRALGGFQFMPKTLRDMISQQPDEEYPGAGDLDDEMLSNAFLADPDFQLRMAQRLRAQNRRLVGDDPYANYAAWNAGPNRDIASLTPKARAHHEAAMARFRTVYPEVSKLLSSDELAQLADETFGDTAVGVTAPEHLPGEPAIPGFNEPMYPDMQRPPIAPVVGGGPEASGGFMRDASEAFGVKPGKAPTYGEVIKRSPLNPLAIVHNLKSLGGAAGAAVGHAQQAAQPAVDTAKDVLATPIGQAPQPGAGAVAAPAPTPAVTPPPAIPPGAAIKVKPPQNFAPEPRAAAPAPASRADDLRAAIDRLRANPDAANLDPDRWWNSLPPGQKALMILGSGLGGFAEGFRGAPNRALESIQARRAADLRAQESDASLRADQRKTLLASLVDELALEQRAAAAGAPKGPDPISEGTLSTLGDWQNAFDQMFQPGGVYDSFRQTGNTIPGVPARAERAVAANVPLIPTATKGAIRLQGPAKRAIQKAFSGADVPERQAEAIADEFMPMPGDSDVELDAKQRAAEQFILGKIRATIDVLEAGNHDTSRLRQHFGLWYARAKAYRPGTFEAMRDSTGRTFMERLLEQGVDPALINEPHADLITGYLAEEL